MRYPPAPRLDVVDDLHGHQVADPYRWLEDEKAPEVQAWMKAQDALTRQQLSKVAGRDALDSTVSTFDRPAEGVALVDSTELDFEQTVAAVLAAVEDQAGTPAVKGGRR